MGVIPRKLVHLVLARDHDLCVLRLAGCLHIASVADHRAPRGAGGSKVLNNPVALVAACGLCNGNRESTTGGVRAGLIDRGVIVPKAATNDQTLRVCRLTPVTYPDGGQYWLTTTGGRVTADRPIPL